MQVKILPSESKINKNWNLVTNGLGFLTWWSPFLGLGIFFPLGVLSLYRLNHTIRAIAFQVLLFQLIVYITTFPLDLYSLFLDQSEAFQGELINNYLTYFIGIWLFAGLVFLFKEAQLYNKSALKNGKESKGIGAIIFSLLFAIFMFAFFIFLSVFAFGQNQLEMERVIGNYIKGDTLIYFWLLGLHSGSILVGRKKKKIMGIFRKGYASLYIHLRLSIPQTDFESNSFKKKAKFAKIREWILPGWGNIYLKRYWVGFSLLFTYLLVVLFTAIAIIYYFDYSVGTKFLGYFQLKTGIPDKTFIQFTSYLVVPIVSFIFLALIYTYSQFVVRNSLKFDNEPDEKRGLRDGFLFNFSLSLLVHLTLIAIILIIPISVQRSASQKRDMAKDHFQPEKMEFYFIDPEIPDDIKDLNGGVISGTETPSQEDGMKIPDEPVSDEGKVKGYVKRIKGKKVPKTYSNYISARMRGPESFLEYWKRAPHPYSCVVAYTITSDGEITDVYMVEGSGYTDQDDLTIELVESMSPVLPPPGVKGDVRVTELFWNGSIDPDAMPTELQKQMVLMFDGRYLEEEP